MTDFSRGAPKTVSADEAKREELAKLASELDWRSRAISIDIGSRAGNPAPAQNAWQAQPPRRRPALHKLSRLARPSSGGAATGGPRPCVDRGRFDRASA